MEIAAELYIFTRTAELAMRLPGFMQALAEGGYTAVEGMAGYPPDSAADMVSSGLRYVGTHGGTGKLLDLAAVIQEAQAKSATVFVASGGLDWSRRTLEDFQTALPVLNEAGRRLRDESGLTLHYHNHDFEFIPQQNGQTGMEILLAGFDPDAVKLCVDLGWVARAGLDPVAFLQEHRDWVGMVHLRDFRGEESVPLGQGDLELRPLATVLESLPCLNCVVVEQEPTTATPLEDLLTSRRYLRDVFGI